MESRRQRKQKLEAERRERRQRHVEELRRGAGEPRDELEGRRWRAKAALRVAERAEALAQLWEQPYQPYQPYHHAEAEANLLADWHPCSKHLDFGLLSAGLAGDPNNLSLSPTESDSDWNQSDWSSCAIVARRRGIDFRTLSPRTRKSWLRGTPAKPPEGNVGSPTWRPRWNAWSADCGRRDAAGFIAHFPMKLPMRANIVKTSISL